VGARTGVGKSILCDNIAAYTSEKLQIPTLIVDTELLKTDHLFRVLSCSSEIPIKEIQNGNLVIIKQK